ncbi:MAG: hypothetical protein LQ352_004202 [Teloschistes flavicans]|nr:MAG: hypothetical protein LQ352_004202 [Teloschistes flavicans]
MVELRLNFVPAQPSRLRHVFAPRSPASPLESTAKRLRGALPNRLSDSTNTVDSSTVLNGQPLSPYKWMWYCHQCRTGYEVGVTRRCLIDDHVLCYGSTIRKKSKKSKKPKKVRACQSEFDYIGWQTWGAWKRQQTASDSPAKEQPKRNCFNNCDWPSQCRWAPKQQEQAAVELNQETAQEVDPQTQEAPSASTSADLSPGLKPTDSVLIKLGSATQKLASHWASMLTPIEEESSPTSIEDFLDLAKHSTDPMLNSSAVDVEAGNLSSCNDLPSVAPLEISKHTSSIPPTEVHPLQAEAQSPAPSASFGDFNFGFHSSSSGDQDASPSIAEGIVASTIGLALSAVPSARAQKGSDERSRRSVSEPLPTLSVWLQERVMERRRRMSEASAM